MSLGILTSSWLILLKMIATMWRMGHHWLDAQTFRKETSSGNSKVNNFQIDFPSFTIQPASTSTQWPISILLLCLQIHPRQDLKLGRNLIRLGGHSYWLDAPLEEEGNNQYITLNQSIHQSINETVYFIYQSSLCSVHLRNANWFSLLPKVDQVFKVHTSFRNSSHQI